MRIFGFLPLLILLLSQIHYGQVTTGDSSVELVSSKWSKYRQKNKKSDNQKAISPQAAMTPANKSFERNRRVNDPVGAPDPNANTTDGRSAALEKIMQESRSTKSEFVDGFLYQVKFRNASARTIEVLFWEYQFKERANTANVESRQYLCGINIKPNKEKELNIFSTSSPSSLVSVDSLADKSGNLFEEKILINRVEYSDGKIWQRKDWNYKEMKPSIDRALSTPWEMETCRNL
jgi:hypothetical protein